MQHLKDNPRRIEPTEAEHLKKQLDDIYNEIDKIDSEYVL
jgi:hypothetical protein